MVRFIVTVGDAAVVRPVRELAVQRDRVLAGRRAEIAEEE